MPQAYSFGPNRRRHTTRNAGTVDAGKSAQHGFAVKMLELLKTAAVDQHAR